MTKKTEPHTHQQVFNSPSPGFYRKVYWLVGIMTLSLFSAYLFSSYQQFQSNILQHVNKNLQDINSLYKSQLKYRTLELDGFLQLIKDDKVLQDAYIRKDRQMLYDLTKDIFNNALKPNDITHFYFTDREGVNFLRVHAPKRFGDKIDRLTQLKSMETQQLSAGVEMGVLGTSTLRAVIPWYSEDKVLLGYIELGVDLTSIFENMASTNQQPLFLTSYKRYLDKKEWESGEHIFGERFDWSLFDDMVVTASYGIGLLTMQSITNLQDISQRNLQENQDEYRFTNRVEWQSIPIFDVQNRNIGYVFVALNLSDWFDDFYNKLIASFALFMTIGVLLFFGLRYFTSSLLKAERKTQNTLQELHFLAAFDPLTGLANRQQFMNVLQHRIDLAKQKNQEFSICFIDIDNFKLINDSLGHASGDELLQKVAKALELNMGEHDFLARFGGDEFLLLSTHSGFTEIQQAIERLQLSNFPVQIQHNKNYVSTSIGVAQYPIDAETPDKLIQLADTAMYHAKQDGKNRIVFYREEMNVQLEREHTIEQELREAISLNELQLYYQPQFSLKSGQIIGFEALVRWVKSNGEVVYPDDFISIAEKTDLIWELDNWVLHEACRQYLHWKEQGEVMHIDVNLSGKHIKDKCIDEFIKNTLDAYAIPYDGIGVEITENIMIKADKNLILQFEKLAKLGVRLSLDDFGTGYSSLSYLKNFPVSILKIDKAFVIDAPSDSNDLALVNAIVSMGHSLGLKVLAEGVELIEHESVMQQICCDYVQGYFYQKPLPANEIDIASLKDRAN